ncbi:N-methylhydantoinase A [Malonomonas rubra DSM 5091]|uniref:N-methylhydantoinase A n=1 Tax=Malonomonas rubra DSM 5091 TaxID=1122189 RepID=A0A1M6E529_MALRU|nr:hydantoinase/oxoprolinase family protein [Malonomonas rubra]SHI80479.1 N-methylhydantoinase A [Malonomonas rubra DSM 5091]
MLIIGIDTGGTFTDFIWQEGNQSGEHKRLSTPHNPAEAVLAGLNHLAGERPFWLVHGSTVATNALLEKKGARTALISNRGFEDIIEIARQNRPELYDLQVKKNPPLVPSELRFGISGRVDPAGEIIETLVEADLQPLLEQLRQKQVESIAVALLFSFNNQQHELLIAEKLKALGLPISLSHQILAEFREYERTSTTLINAYVSPKMDRYLAQIAEQSGAEVFRIMQSNGGSISAATARRESVRTILSGPAGGAVGAHVIGKQSGHHKLITFDMGGTSTDVALIDRHLPLTTESTIAGYPVKVPMIDIHTVGAGGGSIARLDRGGSLQVGPESAGADPGPICYGKGEELTVTDANLYLGRLIPDHFLGGGMQLQTAKVKQKMEDFATQLQLDPIELAEGILAVANSAMEGAIKKISVERGFDPREFTLFSFGGAGGMHAVELAELLQMPQVMVPTSPGILSACGMLMANVIKDYSQTVMLDQQQADHAILDEQFAPLMKQAQEDLREEGVSAERIELQPLLDMRYKGQSFELLVDYTEDFVSEFHQQHQRAYGYASADKPVEIVNLRLRAYGRPDHQLPQQQPKAQAEPVPEAILGQTESIFGGKQQATTIIDRNRLQHGNSFDGPAIITEYSSTIVLPPEWCCDVDPFGHLLLTRKEAEK